jgi:hypothetical protein
MAFNGFAWGTKASTPTPAVPLVPGPDPEHAAPSDDPRFTQGMEPLWANTSGTSVPTLPVEYTASDGVGQVVGGGGPVDHTPQGGMWGVGVGPGLDEYEAQAIRGEWSGLDTGELDAHTYHPMSDRAPNGAPVTSIVPDMIGDGTSPHTLALKIRGVGGTDDPGARRASKMRRITNFRWDRHMYEVETRPMVVKTARTAQAQPAVAQGNQYTSPYATAATAYGAMQPEVFVAPQRRIVPEPWDNPLMVDGTGVSDGQLWSVGGL